MFMKSSTEVGGDSGVQGAIVTADHVYKPGYRVVAHNGCAKEKRGKQERVCGKGNMSGPGMDPKGGGERDVS